jgi:hypothetical protein
MFDGDEKIMLGMAITLIDETTAETLGVPAEIRAAAKRNAEAERKRLEKLSPKAR